MRKVEDLSNQIFGYLKVIEKAENKISGNRTKTCWRCKCLNCGKETTVLAYALKNGHTQSCGCLQKEKVSKHNTYTFLKDYVIGHTEENNDFYFDLKDYEVIKNYYWTINSLGYVHAKIKGTQVLFHRFILNPPEDKIVDHINHNRNDNRRKNLRIVNQKENCENRQIAKNNTSGVTGVFWSKHHNKWKAHIGSKGKRISLGYFVKFEDAVKARKEAEAKYFEVIPEVPKKEK